MRFRLHLGAAGALGPTVVADAPQPGARHAALAAPTGIGIWASTSSTGSMSRSPLRPRRASAPRMWRQSAGAVPAPSSAGVDRLRRALGRLHGRSELSRLERPHGVRAVVALERSTTSERRV